jgi:hypothetical protein
LRNDAFASLSTRNPKDRALARATFHGQFAARNLNVSHLGWNWRHRHPFIVIGWIGPLFWPFAYWDLVNYTYWPYAYDAFWPRAYDDIYGQAFDKSVAPKVSNLKVTKTGGGTFGTERTVTAQIDGEVRKAIMIVSQNFFANLVPVEIEAITDPTLYKKLPFDTEKDLAPVMLINRNPLVLVGRKTLEPSTLQELLALMKKAGILSHGPIPIGPKGSGGKPARKNSGPIWIVAFLPRALL